MIGDIQIFFGKVVDILDDLKINRCRISIDGLTNEIKTQDLPWYFPWYGQNYLPIKNDVVSIIIFDSNFSTGFYGCKTDLKDLKLIDSDYENYLEIFKRSIDDKNIQLTYIKSKGIEFINGNGKIQVELDKLSYFVNSNSIVIDKDYIHIGNEAKQLSLLGDDSVQQLKDMIKHQANTISEMIKLFNAISTACITPFTAPIKAALLPLIPLSQTNLNTENNSIKISADNIQSKKVFIE